MHSLRTRSLGVSVDVRGMLTGSHALVMTRAARCGVSVVPEHVALRDERVAFIMTVTGRRELLAGIAPRRSLGSLRRTDVTELVTK